MKKKTINIIMIIGIIFSLAALILTLYFAIFFCKCVPGRFKMLYVYKVGATDNRSGIVLYTLTIPIALCFTGAALCLGALVSLICCLFTINRTELLAVKESISDYRKRKAEERETKKKLNTEKRKAELLAELDEINRKDKQNGDKTDD